jgi:hypothetical protein
MEHVLLCFIVFTSYCMASGLHTSERLAMKAHFSTAIPSLVRLAAPFGLVLGLGLGLSGPAHAVDGCKLLLCMAGNWRNITQCTPTVREALRDVARGRAWPSCSMGGDSASANQYVAPEQCPQQYITHAGTDESGQPIYSCPFSGVIHVAVQAQPWSRTWWSPSGDSVVQWLPAAKAAFANWPDTMDERFDRDHAAWVISEQVRLAAQAAAAAAAAAQGGGG